jgi:phosphoribosyl-dephospho-CoA transferase
MAARYRPHDLLFARTPGAFEAAGDYTARLADADWLADAAWLARAPLVVRRAAAPAGRIPVGARGPQRKQRCAGTLDADDVARCVTPERLAAAVLAGPALELRAAADALPCIAALLALAPQLHALGLDWGPAGGAGFWLASGLPVLKPDSDLDLLVRAPAPPAPGVTEALQALARHAACRVDIQLDTGAGGFALGEWLRGGRVLLKTDTGPLLLDDPWRLREAA